MCEILRSSARTREYIQEGEREGKSLLDAMEAGGLEGMQTFDGELKRLIEAGVIDQEVALSYSTNPTNLKLKLDMESGGGESPPIGLAPEDDESDNIFEDPGMSDLIER